MELGRDKDFCDPIGTLRNIFFNQLLLNRRGRFQIDANVDGFVIEGVRLGFTPPADFKLVEIGPLSATYKHKPNDPSTWVELFSPDKDIAVRGFRLTDVRLESEGTFVPLADAARFVRVVDQKPNPNYPKTTPRGGIGKVHLIP